MRVFISHSGDRSRDLAVSLADFVRLVLPAAEPWISTTIEKGARWESEVAANLKESGFGIVCLTSENLESPWVLFEAGALSNQLPGKVCTFLLDLTPDQVKPPLGQFQHTKAEESDVISLLKTVNNALQQANEKQRPEKDLETIFKKLWPDLESKIREVRELGTESKQPKRPIDDMLAELLQVARANARYSWQQEKTLKIAHLVYRKLYGEPAPSLTELRRLVNAASSPSAAEPGVDGVDA